MTTPTNGNGNSRLHLLSDHKAPADRNATDGHGRKLRHNATVEDVYQIVAEECAKVHEYYLTQVPGFVAKMIQDALMSYNLIKVEANAEGQPAVVPTTPTPEQAVAHAREVAGLPPLVDQPPPVADMATDGDVPA